MNAIDRTVKIQIHPAVAGKIVPFDLNKPTIFLEKVQVKRLLNEEPVILISGKFIQSKGNKTDVIDMELCGFKNRITDSHNINGTDFWIGQLERLEEELFPREG